MVPGKVNHWLRSAVAGVAVRANPSMAANRSHGGSAWSTVDRAAALIAGLALAALVLLSPEMAAAQTAVTTLDPIEQIVESVIGIMTGPIATGVAIIGVASIGYMWMTGRMEMQRALTIIIGMVIIFGAANIVNALRGSTGFTGAGTIGG